MSERRAREILEEAAKRLLPAVGYLVNPTAGFIASAFIFFTWLVSRRRGGSRRKLSPIEALEDRLIEIREEINSVSSGISVREKALEKASGLQREVLAREIELLEKHLRELEELYRIEHIRYLSWRLILKTRDEKLIKAVEKLYEKIEKGLDPSSEEYRILKKLEEYREKGVLKEVVVEKILESLTR